MCIGNHEIKKNIPCYLTEITCGKVCGKLLSCGLHTCKRLCHSNNCQPKDIKIMGNFFLSY